jgi:hypothetical protein
MWKSRSSMPRFEARLEEDSAPGLAGTAGARDVPAELPDAFVAIHVGMTNDGSELPANLPAGETKQLA